MKGIGAMEWDPTTHYQGVRVAEQYDNERFASLAGRIFNALEKRLARGTAHPPHASDSLARA